MNLLKVSKNISMKVSLLKNNPNMNQKRSLFLFSLIFYFVYYYTATPACAQEYVFKNFSFSDSSIVVPEQFKSYNEIVLQRDLKYQLISLKNSAEEYYLFHEKILVNSTDAIQ